MFTIDSLQYYRQIYQIQQIQIQYRTVLATSSYYKYRYQYLRTSTRMYIATVLPYQVQYRYSRTSNRYRTRSSQLARYYRQVLVIVATAVARFTSVLYRYCTQVLVVRYVLLVQCSSIAYSPTTVTVRYWSSCTRTFQQLQLYCVLTSLLMYYSCKVPVLQYSTRSSTVQYTGVLGIYKTLS